MTSKPGTPDSGNGPGTPARGEEPAATVPDKEHDPLNLDRPSIARRYNRWRRGKDNYRRDRDSAARIEEAFPDITIVTDENRRFMRRAVRYLAAEAGIRQFLDIGTGLPESPNVHEVAQAVAPQSRVVYVDNDREVMVYARALMTGVAEGATAYVEADLRNPEAILADPGLRTLDFSKSIAVLLVAVLHFLDDKDDPYYAVARLIEALPPGSFVVVTHATYDSLSPDTVEKITTELVHGEHGTFRARSHEEVSRFLDGLELLDPGVAPIVQWWPEQEPKPSASAEKTAMYGAVARLP
jgi:hypothetical protein